ncbi:MAG: chemotaxis protein CheW [Myxococcales bacterium]|nr:chemotaxis protein CheW [Myxococcales bacterium]
MSVQRIEAIGAVPRGAKVANAPDETIQLITFDLDGEEYAVEILKVKEIVMMTKITRMPDCPDFIQGVVNLRGAVIPIIDMRKRFHLPKLDTTDATRIIIVDLARETIGMIVDRVNKVTKLPKNALNPPPPIFSGISSEYISGIGNLEDRMLILLDLEKAFDAKEIDAIRTAAEPDPTMEWAA